MKLEVVVVPVSDVDRAKSFYSNLGWRLDADFAAGHGWRRDPIHAARLRVLGDLRQERDRGGSWLRPRTVPRRLRHQERPGQLLRRGVGISEVFHDAGDVHVAWTSLLVGRLGSAVRIPTPQLPLVRLFSDPDGNGWLLRRSPRDYPTRGADATSPVGELSSALTFFFLPFSSTLHLLIF
jgi:catechol 2,3-dioxygenase-like lactoylglutathione lyase family enzyme